MFYFAVGRCLHQSTERNTTSTDWWRTEVGSPPPGCQGGARATQAFGIKKFFRQKKWTMDTHSWPDTVSDNPLISEPPEISWLTLKKPQSYTSLCDLPLGVRSLRKSRPCLDFVCHNRLTRLLAISEDNLWIRTLRKVLNFQQSSVKLRLENSSCWQNVFLLKSTICSYLFAKNGDEFNFRQIFWRKDHFSQKYQIRNCRLECTQCPFKPSLWFCKMCKKTRNWSKTLFKWPLMPSRLPLGSTQVAETGTKNKICQNQFSVTNFRSSDHDDDKFALIPLMLAMLSFCVICHPRRQIRCPVRSQSHYCRRNEYKLNKKRRFSEKLPAFW